MTSSRFDLDLTSVQPQKPWTSPFYGSLNGSGFKTLIKTSQLIKQLKESKGQDQ